MEMISLHNLVEKLANDLIHPIEMYKTARKNEALNNKKENDGITDLFDQDDYIEDVLRYEKKEAKIRKSEYWYLIIRAKIETISAIGGTKLMKEVCDKLESHPENHIYKFNLVFDAAATGIDKWIK